MFFGSSAIGSLLYGSAVSNSGIYSNYSRSNIIKTAMVSKLDPDRDKKWSYSDTDRYVVSVNKLAGSSLDTDAIFAKYDADGDGVLSSAEQASALADDAFGLSGSDESSSGNSQHVLMESLMSTGSYSKYGYFMSALKTDASLSLIGQTFGLNSKNNLFSSVFGAKTAASALASYFASKYSENHAVSKTDVTI